tara:strand:+ start:297 stop:986 length:690 start_codon:yes stop_codon:yes gene_type:complete
LVSGLIAWWKRQMDKLYTFFGGYRGAPSSPTSTGTPSKRVYSDDAEPWQIATLDSSDQTNNNTNQWMDVRDSVFNTGVVKPSEVKPTENPEDFKGAYFPAGGLNGGRRPNIAALRLWVQANKIGQDKFQGEPNSNFKIDKSFQEAFGYVPNGLTIKEREYEIDRITYLVARKIWYVGRKPSSMNDPQWDELTRDMRPAEGSFHHKNSDEWGGSFPYGQTYKYRSGYVSQ